MDRLRQFTGLLEQSGQAVLAVGLYCGLLGYLLTVRWPWAQLLEGTGRRVRQAYVFSALLNGVAVVLLAVTSWTVVESRPLVEELVEVSLDGEHIDRPTDLPEVDLSLPDQMAEEPSEALAAAAGVMPVFTAPFEDVATVAAQFDGRGRGDYGSGEGLWAETDGRGVGTTDGTGDGDGGDGEKASFFGITAAGKSFVFVVDISGSMSGLRFAEAKKELQRSVDALRQGQEFSVVFYNHNTYPLSADNLLEVNDENLRKTRLWLGQAACQGSTNPLPAIQKALTLQPDAIFFLTDGDFAGHEIMLGTQQQLPKKVPIHTICFLSPAGQRGMQWLARATGGTYLFVGPDWMQGP